MRSFDPTEQHAEHNRRTIEHWAPIVSRQAIGNQLFFRRNASTIFSASDIGARVDFTKPVIVCGAGPSLKETLERITPENRGKFTIIAVDTSFHPVIRAGVFPDLVITLDPEGNLLEKTFLDSAGLSHDVAKHGTVLMAPSFAHRSMLEAWIKTFRRPVYIYHPFDPHNPAYEKLRQLYPQFPAFASKPNVGQFAVDVAFLHGAREIAFAGLDLSYRNGKGYVDGVGHASSDIPDDARMLLLGNDMQPVSTSYTFFFDHLNFVDMLRGYEGAGAEVFNLSRGIVPAVNRIKEFFEKHGEAKA